MGDPKLIQSVNLEGNGAGGIPWGSCLISFLPSIWVGIVQFSSVYLIGRFQMFFGMFLYLFHFHKSYLFPHPLPDSLSVVSSLNQFLPLLFFYHNLYLILYRKGLHILGGRIFFVPMGMHFQDTQLSE